MFGGKIWEVKWRIDMRYKIKSIELTIKGKKEEIWTIKEIHNFAIEVMEKEGMRESMVWVTTQILDSSNFMNSGFIIFNNGIIEFIEVCEMAGPKIFSKDTKCFVEGTTIKII
jgi:hypothetical protein